MKLNLTQYYEEFLRYYEMASWQHDNCNLGDKDYSETPWDDDLIKEVKLYDVVQRKYAGFTQILLDMWYMVDDHPYSGKMDQDRIDFVDSCDYDTFHLDEWLFIFFVHRLTGSGINYALSPSGYHNSILPKFTECSSIPDMVEVIRAHEGPMFTSVGYQIAPFPKPVGKYDRGGVYFMCEVLPGLCVNFAAYLIKNKRATFRDAMEFLINFNRSRGYRAFHFQYAATLADIADFFPKLIDIESPFFYGKNAIECLSYMSKKPRGMSKLDFLDALTDQISRDTGMYAYNAEDVACDSIRWVENYINPKADYSHLDLDTVWSSHKIIDHPFGRQKPMLELGLLESFNGFGHPSDDKVIKSHGISVGDYKKMVRDML